MRAVVQRVTSSCVRVEENIIGTIGRGLLVLLGVGREDTEQDAVYLADKISELRVFEDNDGKMNRSLSQLGKEENTGILVVSQFTLYGDCRKGRRPSYIQAQLPDEAERLYSFFVRLLREKGFLVETGVFQADMQVEIHNDGPVTLLLDSKKEF